MAVARILTSTGENLDTDAQAPVQAIEGDHHIRDVIDATELAEASLHVKGRKPFFSG